MSPLLSDPSLPAASLPTRPGQLQGYLMTTTFDQADNGATGPLAGVRVVDMTSVGMGPYASQILGDMGATVLKVESPEGDAFRHAAPARNSGMGAAFLNLNRNKLFVTLDIKHDPDLRQLLALINEADIFISNVRPKSLRRLGLDYETLSADHPRLIYCGAYGYSEKGPYAGQPAFDDIIQARSGMAVFQGANGASGPQYVNTVLADKVAGLTIAYAIPMALYEREKSGLGQAIEVPMFETLVSFLAVEQLAGQTFVPSLGNAGYSRVMSSHRRPYRTLDGYVALLPYTTAQWQRFFELAGRDDLAQDPRYANMSGRSAAIDELYEELADIVATKTTDRWLELLGQADIPHSPVPSFDELLDDEHLNTTGLVYAYNHPTEGALRGIGIPTRFSRTPGNIRRLPQSMPARASDKSDL
jgi:crotonobetainyl-CoA:carnitine CoA-transferase CaiB-like acyl-CoA transferase